MAERNDGGSAFPALNAYATGQNGMSLRDWFAGQALMGMMAAEVPPNMPYEPPSEIAAIAYDCADAMLARRTKIGGQP